MEESRFEDDDETSLRLLSREELERRVRRRSAALENVMDTMVDVLLRLDPEGRIRMANEALYDILDYEEGEVVGKPVDYVFASAEKNEQLSDMMTKGELLDTLLTRGYVKDVEIYFVTADDEAIPMSLSASVMEDDEGGLAGIVCVAKDISERKAAEERAEFLHSLLRHDLSNKLQVIKGNLQLAGQGDLPDRTEQRIDNALKGIADATELVENVRMLNRLEGEIEPEPVRLDVTLHEAVERHEDLRRQKDVTITNDVEGPVTVRGGSILKELFANLIENALVHSGGSEVHIDAEETDEEVVVTVEDDGEGVPDDQKDKILQKGYSGTGSTGSGLGMHLVGEIADTYDGEFEVLDSELGGARFDVVLQKPHGSG